MLIDSTIEMKRCLIRKENILFLGSVNNPSLNRANSLKIPARISYDPRHRGSCQDLFKIFAYVLVIPVYRIFQGPTRSCSGFQQVPNKN